MIGRKATRLLEPAIDRRNRLATLRGQFGHPERRTPGTRLEPQRFLEG